jgi:hypothetical protein
MRAAKLYSVSNNNRKLLDIEKILTYFNALRGGTTKKTKRWGISVRTKSNGTTPTPKTTYIVPESKAQSFMPPITQIDPQTNNNYPNDKDFKELINPKRLISRPNSPKNLISSYVTKRKKVDQTMQVNRIGDCLIADEGDI